MKTKKKRRPLVHYFAHEMGYNGGSMTGTVRTAGDDLGPPRVRKFDFSWGTHDAYWGDGYASQDDDVWYNEVQQAIGDAVDEAITASGLRDPSNDYFVVDADVIYDDDVDGVPVVRLRIIATADYDEDDNGDPKDGLPWIDIVKQP